MNVELRVGDKVAVMVKHQVRWFIVLGADKDEVHIDPMDDYGNDWIEVLKDLVVALDMVSIPARSIVGWRAREA